MMPLSVAMGTLTSKATAMNAPFTTSGRRSQAAQRPAANAKAWARSAKPAKRASPKGPRSGQSCRERRVHHTPTVVKGAFTTPSNMNAPFTTPPV